jgi:hypothetical protein
MSEIISWDKAIDKKVKSSDDKDLGKVQAITRDYVQTKEGIVSKNYYFIPRYYITGYDGSNLWVSLTRDEVKSRFESDKEPDITRWQTPDYEQRRTSVSSQYPDFETTIPSYRLSTDAGVPLSWDKIIGKDLRSADKKDVGKVESISTDYIEVKEGVVSKKHYFVPKYYIQGYDGDRLYAALTKEELKSRYERDSPPSPEEFQQQEYRERVRSVDAENPQFLHGIPWMAKEPSTQIPVDYSGTTYNIPWDEIVHKHVRTTDNVEVGYVERVGNEFLVVREGVADVHIYYVPKAYIRDYDGAQLWIDAPSTLVRAKFEKEHEPSPEELRALASEAPRFRRPAPANPDKVTIQEDVDLTKVSEGS